MKATKSSICVHVSVYHKFMLIKLSGNDTWHDFEFQWECLINTIETDV